MKCVIIVLAITVSYVYCRGLALATDGQNNFYADPLGICDSRSCFKKECPRRENEQYTKCKSHCPNICGKGPKDCGKICVAGCTCKSGYCLDGRLWDEYAVCIPEDSDSSSWY